MNILQRKNNFNLLTVDSDSDSDSNSDFNNDTLNKQIYQNDNLKENVSIKNCEEDDKNNSDNNNNSENEDNSDEDDDSDDENNNENNDDSWECVGKKYKNNKFSDISFLSLTKVPLDSNFPRNERNELFEKRVYHTKKYLMNILFFLSANCRLTHKESKTKIKIQNSIKTFFIENNQNHELTIQKWSEDCVDYLIYSKQELFSFENSRQNNQSIYFKKFLIIFGLWEIFNLSEPIYYIIQNHFYSFFMNLFSTNLSNSQIMNLSEIPSIHLTYLSNFPKEIYIPDLDKSISLNDDPINQIIKDIFFNLIFVNMTHFKLRRKVQEKYWPQNCNKLLVYQQNYDYFESINIIIEETKEWLPIWFYSRQKFCKDCYDNNNLNNFIYEFYYDFIRLIGLNDFLNISLMYHGHFSKKFLIYSFENYINDNDLKNKYIDSIEKSHYWNKKNK